ncbi:MAG: outer-membrane lipoprotein carrier protein LolA [Thiotrichales bacterium]|nr:outer-membrane lipoprotein carrier protein LolA [Thiotrichales bacterium]
MASSMLLSGALWAHPLQDFVNQLKTFEADFSQVLQEDGLMEFVQKADKGHFQLSRPSRLVWEYAQKDGQKIVLDGVNLWVWDKDLKQVTVRPVAEVQGDIPLSWLLYDEPIEDKFTIIFAGNRAGMQWYNLAPKEATYFQSIEIALKDGLMSEAWLYEGSDKITKIRFSNIQINQTLNEAQFQFLVPPGNDLVGTPLPLQ